MCPKCFNDFRLIFATVIIACFLSTIYDARYPIHAGVIPGNLFTILYDRFSDLITIFCLILLTTKINKLQKECSLIH